MSFSETFEVRPVQPADREAVRRVNAAAFGGDRVPDMVEALTAAGDVLVGLVAEVNGDVVGHVQLSRCWVDARERLVEVAVLSPLATAPDHQRRGIGTALVAHAIATAREAGEPAVFLEGDPDFYSSRGFVAGSSLGFGRPSPRIPEPAFQVALLDEDLPRGALVYCQTFWTQDCVGLRDPRLAAVEGHLAGRD
jgi:putative acetyltransferase